MEQSNQFSKYWHSIIRILIVAILYFLLGEFAFAISVSNNIVTNAPFFAEGVGLASTILFGYVNAIGVFIGQFVLAITSGLDVSSSIGISLVNSILAIVGRYLFFRFRFSDTLLGFKNVLLISTIVVFVVQPLSAISGNLILVETGRINSEIFWVSSMTWWLGNSIGQLVLVPFLLLLFSKAYSTNGLLLKDIMVAILGFVATFLIFKFTYYIDNNYTFLAIFLLYPFTLIFSSHGRPETVVLSLFSMTVAAFIAISLNIVNLSDINRWDTFMKLDLLILGLQLSGLILTFLMDDKNKVENELRQNEALLKDINTTKDKLFSIIAHDLKSPFTSIVGYSEILREYTANCTTDEVVRYATIVNTSSKQALQLLENLLDWARLQQGWMIFRPKNINLFDTVTEVVDLFRDIAEQKGVAIQISSSSNVEVLGDKEMIKTVLRNLISNAIKFTNAGGTVDVSIKQSDSDILVSISDNGVGISPNDFEKLFDISSNFTTQGTNEETGTGLGLSLCKEFVERHNGKIWVKSEPGKGSKFTFSLPLVQY